MKWVPRTLTSGEPNSLIARFADQSSGGAGLTPDMLKIEIQNDIAGNPGGTLLGTLTSTADITAEANYGFSPTLSISLDGLTNYWLVAKPTNADSVYGWFVTASGTDNGQSGWSLADGYAGTADSGASWIGSLPAVPILSIDATLNSAAVPEPASFVFIGLSCAGFAIRRRVKFASELAPSMSWKSFYESASRTQLASVIKPDGLNREIFPGIFRSLSHPCGKSRSET